MTLRLAICSVGTEITLGDQVDTNAAWLSQQVRALGIEITSHVAVSDELDDMVANLAWLRDRHDAVIVGGGLGPTHDDRTREAIAEVAGAPLEQRPELEEEITRRFAALGARMPAQNLQQARIPAGAQVLPPVGSAPGFRVEAARPDGARCVFYALPGVPWELRELYTRDVEPDLLALAGHGASITRIVHVTGMGESAVGEVLAPVIDAHDGRDDIVIALLAPGDEIQVRVTARGEDPAAARARSQPVVDAISGRLGRAVTGLDEESLEESVARLLRQAGQTVAVAESATAGAICARLARPRGASEILQGGVVVYATDAKQQVLQVPAQLLAEHGPVSEPVTCELAVRVRELFGSGWGIGVTGVAGPTTQGGQPVGTVFWAVSGPDGEVQVHGRRFPGDRAAVQRRLVAAALEALRRRLLLAAAEGG